MSVNNVSGKHYAYNGYSVIKEHQKAEKEEAAASTAKTEEAVVADKANKNEDSYVKSTDKSEINTDTYRPSTETVAQARIDRTRNVSAFKAMSEALFKGQAGKTGGHQRLQDVLKNITGDAAVEGADDTSFDDDPAWGVEAVATRILDFAKSLAGDDPSKIDMLRDAVKKGFEAAASAWGSELPGISQRTYDKIMEGFDEWQNPSSAVEEE